MVFHKRSLIGFDRYDRAEVGILDVIQLVQEGNDVLKSPVESQKGSRAARVILLLRLYQIMLDLGTMIGTRFSVFQCSVTS